MQKGVKVVGDFLSIKDEFPNLEELRQKFNMQINYLTYYSLRAVQVE